MKKEICNKENQPSVAKPKFKPGDLVRLNFEAVNRRMYAWELGELYNACVTTNPKDTVFVVCQSEGRNEFRYRLQIMDESYAKDGFREEELISVDAESIRIEEGDFVYLSLGVAKKYLTSFGMGDICKQCLCAGGALLPTDEVIVRVESIHEADELRYCKLYGLANPSWVPDKYLRRCVK